MTAYPSVRFGGVVFYFHRVRNQGYELQFRNDNGDTRTYARCAPREEGTLVYIGQRWRLVSAHFLPKNKGLS